MPIQILPDAVASQIAAGEVVERPASVVKELLENALDAGASQITVRVEGAGQRLIEVADDGLGISEAELCLAVARHATSKLRTAHDLLSIETLGFRGEALASIASVSRFVLTSRNKESDTGARVMVDGGQTGKVEKTGVPVGTVVRVEDLFFNVPARLKFLKSDATERGRISELVTRYALAYPDVRIKLVFNGKPSLQTSGNGDYREVLTHLLGLDVAREMLAIQLKDPDLQITGFISPITVTRATRRELTFFVNGRWVQDSSLSAAVLKAYQQYLPVGRYPLAVIFLNIDPQDVDVNVHPAKAEVRFRQSATVFNAVQRAVRRGLLAYMPAPVSPQSTWQTYSGQDSSPAQRALDPAWGMAAELDSDHPQQGQTLSVDGQPEGEFQSQPMQVQPSLPADDLPLLRLVGQVGATYLVAEGPDGLYLIDQYTAHHRVLYEALLARGSKHTATQTLLEPVVLQLSAQAANMVESHLDLLGEFGFQLEGFGPNIFRLYAVPAFLTDKDPLTFMQGLTEALEKDDTDASMSVQMKLAAKVSRQAAIKGGQVLNREEQQALLNHLVACQSPRTSPDGRPTMIHLSVDLLDRQFGRRIQR
jgi:DNA mismatch repair protein MutL